MNTISSRLTVIAAPLLAAVLLHAFAAPADAYIEAAHSFGAVVTQSTNVFLMRVEAVDREKKIIIFRKIQDIKAKHGQDVIKHNFNQPGLRPDEWKIPLDWAEPGKLAVMFHNGGLSETCIGKWWYQSSSGGDWWNHVHGEPFLLRTYSGPPEKLVGIVTQLMEGKEIIVPCMIDGDKEDLHFRRAKMQRLKASLKLQDYNAKRDFVGWGGEDFRRVVGMAGFTHISALGRADPDARAVSFVDFDGDGKQDICLVGGNKVMLLQNGGEALSEVILPNVAGAHSAVWADYNGDGKPDLLLATSTGLRLLTNIGGGFRDDSHLLPADSRGNITAAAWLDHDGDGKPDILCAIGYHGLRLFRNVGAAIPTAPSDPKLGPWHHLGPFDNTGNQGFDASHPVEKTVDLKAEYVGKGKQKIRWQRRDFQDNALNDLRIYNDNDWSATYLYREIEVKTATDLPVSLGSDDTITVWLNSEKILANNVMRGAAPDQEKITLRLKPGKNHFLMKICNGSAGWAFYFHAEPPQAAIPQGRAFDDVSDRVGLGRLGIGANLKGDTITVCDVNRDGRPDFLFGAGTGLLVLSDTNARGEPAFSESKASGITLPAGKTSPAFADVDGQVVLAVPHQKGVSLFRADAKGTFTDITAKTGAVGTFTGRATSAAWGDLDNDGHLDLVIGCLRGCNRIFRNKGDGTFEDATDRFGLSQHLFNSQAVGLIDLNNDGYLDLVFNNEGQESVVLLGNNAVPGKCVPLTLTFAARQGIIGSRVEVTGKDGKVCASCQITGGEGRGGQQPAVARFALAPGAYRVVVRLSSGQTRTRDITLGADPLRARIEEPAEQAGNQ